MAKLIIDIPDEDLETAIKCFANVFSPATDEDEKLSLSEKANAGIAQAYDKYMTRFKQAEAKKTVNETARVTVTLEE